MKRGGIASCLVAFAISPLFIFSSPARTQELPLRSECIVGIENDGPFKSGETDIVFRFFTRWLSENQPNAPYFSWTAHPDGRVFLLFPENCDNRFSFTAKMVRQFNESQSDLHLRFDPRPVEPSDNTINTYGDHWRDGAVPSPYGK